MIYFGFYSVWYDWFLTFLNSLCGCCGLQKKWSVCQGSLCRQRLGLLSEFYFGWLVSALQRICPHFCLLKTCTVGFKASCDELHANPCETKSHSVKSTSTLRMSSKIWAKRPLHLVQWCPPGNAANIRGPPAPTVALPGIPWSYRQKIIRIYIQISEYSMLGRCSFFCGLSQLGFYDSVSQSLKPGKICCESCFEFGNMIRQVHSGLEASSKYNNTTNLY